MKRTLLTSALASLALLATAQTEHRDSLRNISQDAIPEALPESDYSAPIQTHPNNDFIQENFKESLAPEKPLAANPLALPTPFSATTIPNAILWSSHNTLYGLGDIRNATIGYGIQTGHWTLEAMATGEKYQFQTTAFNNFVIGGRASYALSDNWSLTAFGQYSANQRFHSMAAYPYISQSMFGGTINYKSDNVGLRLGARQYYDPFLRKWQTEPIVAPSFKIGNLPIEADFGPLILDLLEHAVRKSRDNGPIIMPRQP